MFRTSRWLVPLALVVVLFPLLAACGGSPTVVAPTSVPVVPTPEPTPAVLPLSEYRDPAGYYTISYPTGWQIQQEAQKVTFTSGDTGLYIMVQYADAGRTLDEAGMRSLIDTYFSPESFGNVEGFQRENETPQGDGSILVEYSFGKEGLSGYGGSFFEQRGTVVYILSFWALDVKQWDPHVATFDAVANSFKPTPTDNWTSLASTTGGFEIAYPPAWQGQEADGNVLIRKDDETFLLITSTVNSAADADAVERQIVENAIAMLRDEDPNAVINGPDTLVLGGEEGYYADFRYTDPQTGLENQGTVVGLVHNDRAYRMLLFSLTEDAETNLPLFTQMLLSFTFKQ